MPYHTRQVCKNGHTITQHLDEYPDQGQNYCSCGAETISECPDDGCNQKIRGSYYLETVIGEDEEELMDRCPECGQEYPWAIEQENEESDEVELSPLEKLRTISSRFEQATLPIRNRRRGRDGVEIEDEYDVQDLFEMILKTEFEDVRTEEPTPQNGGGSSSIDFLLRSQNVAIEIKETSGNRSNEIGNQLSEDIDNYSEHHNAENLFCFVYDQENVIDNPRGFKEDLEREPENGMSVEIMIRPNRY